VSIAAIGLKITAEATAAIVVWLSVVKRMFEKGERQNRTASLECVLKALPRPTPPLLEGFQAAKVLHLWEMWGQCRTLAAFQTSFF